MSKKSVIVIHWCWVTNPWQESEELTLEAKLRLFWALKSIEEQADINHAIYVSGWLAQTNYWQKESESKHMKRYLEKMIQEYFWDLQVDIQEEGESTDTFENVANVIQKTKKDLIEALNLPNKITVYTSAYHTPRVRSIRQNTLKKQWIPTAILDVFSVDTLSFNNPELRKEYRKTLEQYKKQRSNRPLAQKTKWLLTELVWLTFSYLWLDQYISQLHEKIAHRKNKQTKIF